MQFVLVLLSLILCLIGLLADDKVIRYDTYTGNTLTDKQFKQYIKENITFWCSGSYKPCDPNEPRRLDATCNNLQYPFRGPMHTPSLYELPLEYNKDGSAIRPKSGGEPIPARKQRTTLLAEGSVPDTKFTAMTPNYMLFMVSSVASIHDTVDYVLWLPYCCQPKGKKEPRCAPMTVPSDDFVHQFSGVRCYNMTKPFTFQNQGCTRMRTNTPDRINSGSNFLDLFVVYGSDNSLRTMKDGLLQYEVDDNGITWPVSTDPRLFCLLNQLPQETRCHKHAATNAIMGTNIFTIIFLRLHNYIAQRLKEYNPCWDDDKLFFTAREINIALTTQIYYYELMTHFMGKENLIRDGVIAEDNGFRELYNKKMVPQTSLEYVYALRWVHTIQPGLVKMYDTQGHYLKQIPSVNITLRTGYYAVDKNILWMTQGLFRQPSAKIDHIIDPFMAETALPKLQYAFDVTAADLKKSGLMGIAPYIKFRTLCTGEKYSSYDDLAEDIAPEYIDVLKSLYKNAEDIPLMAGMWLEKNIPGGLAPRTMYCLLARQMKRFAQYDRFWYESPSRPNAFNQRQLSEIRKASMSGVLCTVGDSVTKIQPNSFLQIGPGNELTSCGKLPQIDLSAWADSSCDMGTESSCES